VQKRLEHVRIGLRITYPKKDRPIEIRNGLKTLVTALLGDDIKHGDYKYYKKVRDHWDQEFSRATIDVKATVTLRRSGIRTKSFLSEVK
jgi:hypothetical protein